MRLSFSLVVLLTLTHIVVLSSTRYSWIGKVSFSPTQSCSTNSSIHNNHNKKQCIPSAFAEAIVASQSESGAANSHRSHDFVSTKHSRISSSDSPPKITDGKFKRSPPTRNLRFWKKAGTIYLSYKTFQAKLAVDNLFKLSSPLTGIVVIL